MTKKLQKRTQRNIFFLNNKHLNLYLRYIKKTKNFTMKKIKNLFDF